MTHLRHKVALVTSAARGIGRAIAERFGRLGASVVVNYSKREQQAQETVWRPPIVKSPYSWHSRNGERIKQGHDASLGRL